MDNASPDRPQSRLKRSIITFFGVVIGTAVVVSVGMYLYGVVLVKNSSSSLGQVADEANESAEEFANLPREEIMPVTKELLQILHGLYYVSIDTSANNDSDVSGLLISMMTEAMKDKNQLDKLILRADILAKKRDKVVRTTGMVLVVGMSTLAESQQMYIDFLRDVDSDNLDIAETQYQMALFSSTNKDAFMTMVEGTSLFPYIYLEIGDDESQLANVRISPEEKNQILAYIDQLFGDLFIEDDAEHVATGNRNAVILIVKSYKDFIEQL